MMRFITKIPLHIRYITSIYLAGMLFFTLFRFLLFITEIKQLEILPDKFTLISKAFIMGWRFDTVISGYLLFFPLLILSIASFLKFNKTRLYNSIHVFLILLYTLAFLICTIDIPFFNYYFSRLSIVVLSWMQNASFGFKMILEEMSYLVYFFVFMAVCIAFYYLLSRIKKKIKNHVITSIPENKLSFYTKQFVFSILTLGILFIGIRGRIEKKSPIKVGTAFFSNYAFPNQLGLNPVFTFIQSYLESINPENNQLQLMDEKLAIQQANTFMNITDANTAFVRHIPGSPNPLHANVVVVIMESMSAEKMGRYGNPKNLTPFLDSIANINYSFDHFYSAGIHTFNGIFSTLFSYPALLKQHPMNATVIPQFTGFSNTLKDFGYQNIYITTHDEQFDNVSGFLHANGFDQIISQKDYPSKEILSTLGVPDHYMFEYAIPVLNERHSHQQPFFAAFMTASDHGPYIIPEGIDFKPRQKAKHDAIVEYADWALRHFISLASQQTWFNNTIFVFLADHGAVVGSNVYDMPYSYNHIPLIIYAPKLLKSTQAIQQPGGQIDVFPTIMGLLGFPFVNNTAGIDLLNESRPFMYFSADDKIGCSNDTFFYVYRINGKESLYKYKKQDTHDYLAQYKMLADSMKAYSFSMLQASQWMIQNKKTGMWK
ncbi:MAG: sulfatase-like hydrolase/transferase [Bacteroidota bacterium]